MRAVLEEIVQGCVPIQVGIVHRYPFISFAAKIYYILRRLYLFLLLALECGHDQMYKMLFRNPTISQLPLLKFIANYKKRSWFNTQNIK
jgi:hypothetical protein